MPSVEDTAVSIGPGPILIKNLGPDLLYIGGHDVTGETGFPLAVGETVSVLYTNWQTSAVSGGTSDMRVLLGGSAFSASAPAPE
jgi:hypothetical protein